MYTTPDDTRTMRETGPMFTLSFDMRAPAWGAPAADFYAAAIDMCAWAETRGAIVAVLSEHHATDDGHLPSPLILASAIAARTSSQWMSGSMHHRAC